MRQIEETSAEQSDATLSSNIRVKESDVDDYKRTLLGISQ